MRDLVVLLLKTCTDLTGVYRGGVMEKELMNGRLHSKGVQVYMYLGIMTVGFNIYSLTFSKFTQGGYAYCEL